MEVMRPGEVLWAGVALLAVLFFVGGAIEAFEDYRADSRRGQRRWQGRRRAPSPTDLGKDYWPARRPTLVSPGSLQGTPALSMAEMKGGAGESVEPEQPSPDELEQGKLVVHYANGRVIKGFSYDFSPNKPLFHLLPPVAGFSFADEAVEVRLKDLKAVFFVRDFVGDPSYNERKEFLNGQRPLGRKVAVTFLDGETLVGSTMGYDRKRVGFFLTPPDPKSNNLKVFVISRTATRIRFL